MIIFDDIRGRRSRFTYAFGYAELLVTCPVCRLGG